MSIFDVGRVADFKFEEASGDVCLNGVRSAIGPSNTEFDEGLGVPDAYGDVPAGWSGYANVGPGGSVDREVTGSDTLLLTATSANNPGDHAGIGLSLGFANGKTVVCDIEYRWVRRDENNFSGIFYFGPTKGVSTFAPNTDDVGVWYRYRVTGPIDAAGAYFRLYGVASQDATAQLEIRFCRTTEEHAGTPTEDLAGMTGPGISGRGLVLNGTDQAVDLPYALCQAMAGVDEATVALAFKGSEPRSAVRLQPDGGNYLIVPYKSGATYYVGLSTAGGATQFAIGDGSDFADGDWHTLVYTFTRNTTNGQKLYIDGAVAYQANAPDVALPGFALNSLPARIGAYGGNTEWAAGAIDEVSLAVRAWSASEAAGFHASLLSSVAVLATAEPLGVSLAVSL